MPRLNNPAPWLRIAVWAVACVAYLAAIMSRTSLSATGAIASDRFDLTSDQLAAFGILQLFVYAGAQIPVGMLIDRLGGRTVLLVGVAIVAGSQLLIGFGDSFGVLLAARAFAGLGDAMVFPSAVRLTAVSLPSRWIATGTQMIGVVGNFGMVVTATPLVVLVDLTSWPVGYSIMAAFTGAVALAAGGILALMGRDPSRTASGESLGSVLRGTGEAMRQPGSWLAFTTHLMTSAAFTAFVVTWGPMFLEHGAGLDAAGVGAYLLGIPVTGMVAGLVIGRVIVGRPRLRAQIVFGSVVLQIVAWILALAWPAPTPIVLLAILAIATGIGGPASLTAFEMSRDYVPGHLAARANGVVNTGGFSGALVIIWLTGAMLTLQGARTPDDYSMEMFRIAYLPMLGMLAVGAAVFLVLNRRIRRQHRD
ncbi:MFS transporter [Microbacterium karelineae]|uniref:MFS transporter n=1 Tax=Microbacterium karelineae TaxID=2654283 RepID=UPI0012EAF188|nr:MFS transporter [Microbacterium karelineae]